MTIQAGHLASYSQARHTRPASYEKPRGLARPRVVRNGRGAAQCGGHSVCEPTFWEKAKRECPFPETRSKKVRPRRGSTERAARRERTRSGPSPHESSTRQMSSREICKYFLHGACRNGASCRFSHQIDAPKSTVCTYYLAGNCAYGDKCRYDHVRPKVRFQNTRLRSRYPTVIIFLP